jgi:hypothetical protein
LFLVALSADVAQCGYFGTKNDDFDGRREAGLNKPKKKTKNVS